MGFNWTPENEARLWEIAPVAKSVREIADQLGVTRNTIIGKAWRIGLALPVGKSGPRRPDGYVPITRKRGTGISFRAKFRRPPTIIPYMPEPDSINLAFEDLRNRHCRFPVTDEAPFFFCGNDKHPGSSYCAHHHRVCHVGR